MPNKPRPFRKPRRQIEIYFILYLVALMLLLPDKREREPDSDPSLVYEILKSRFFIAAEKTTLNCQLVAIGDSVRVIACDSVNTVSFGGEVSDVHYEFQVEDETQGQILSISSQKPQIGVFAMREDTKRGLAQFFWQPARNEKRGRTLNVRVIATGKPIIPPSITRPDVRERLEKLLNEEGRRDTVQTEFTINISFVDGGRNFAYLGAQNVDSLVSALQRASTIASLAAPPTIVFNRSPILPPGEFGLGAVNERIDALPFSQWENQINVYGMINLRTETRIPPRIQIIRTDKSDGSGTATITDVSENKLKISGVAPSAGLMTVRLAVVRSDGKQQLTDFTVRSMPVAVPEIPKKMFAGASYEFDPQLPFITGQEMRAVLLQSGRERAIGQQGAKFIFVPDEADIGKIFTFERSIGGKRIGEVYNVRVEEFPAPEIVEVFSQGAIDIVRTRCYGQVGGRENSVKLEAKGNLNINERYGDRERSAQQEILQRFEVRKSEADKAFQGTLRAIDAKGRASIAKFIDRKD
jgi:hypothetical protein